MRQRILFIPTIDLNGASGAAVHYRHIIEGFRRCTNWEVQVLMPPTTVIDNNLAPIGVLRKVKTWHIGLELAQQLEQNLANMMPCICYLRYNYANYPVFRLLHKKGVPYILEINTDMQGELNCKRNYFALIWNSLVEKQILHNSSGILSVSQNVLEKIKRRYHLDNIPFGITYNGADTRILSPTSLDDRLRIREQMGIPKESFVWAFIGKLSTWHGLDLFLEAMASIDDLTKDHLLLIGSSMERYSNLISALKLSPRIHKVPWVPETELGTWLAAADMGLGTMALFRKDMSDAQSLKVRTYLACGIPVLSGAHLDIAKGRHLAVFSADLHDKQRGREEIVTIRSQVRSNSEQLRQAARQEAEQFYSWDSIIRHTEDFINECLRG
ncbi:MAG: glycosyltransferase family 4 protein [Actinobacteria bacterium]|nr:glycosyltransferase family 4 protein [Actinomycetota bacterium]